jgi:(p)ppGpp synthase/HD superfamily hydrolase
MTGVLHDIVEETNVTLEQLRQLGCPDRVVEAIGCLTWRKEQESYEQYIQRLKPNSLAASVKRADLEDHLTPPIDCGQN